MKNSITIETVKDNTRFTHNFFDNFDILKIMANFVALGHNPLVIAVNGSPVNQDWLAKEQLFCQHLGVAQ